MGNSKQTERKPLVILTGPTAAGKTALSIQLAKKIGGEIISADSMQVYRHMDIGSAKISLGEQEGIPHHLIDVLEPEEEFHVVQFQTLAKEAIREIYERGHIPIVTGGTGFYIQALLYDIDFSAEEDHVQLRQQLEEESRKYGNQWLWERLLLVDREAAEEIHPNNVKRVIRALEFYRLNGYPISQHNRREREKKSPYAFCYFVLTDEREALYRRIDERVEQMLAKGLLEEVKQLRERGCTRELVSMQGLGYKEILSMLDGEISLEEAVYLTKRNTRHFAKRQLTWFKRERDVIWINKKDFRHNEGEILAFMIEQLAKNKIWME